MRLIDVFTHEIQTFDGVPPPYAALSHRWFTEEISFEIFTNPEGARGPGYDKIIQCCAFVAKHRNWRAIGGVSWCWIDTCCIDKRSSSELSEAINSMAAWYRDAAYCVAYLSDVPPFSEGHDAVHEYFGYSKWWQRGWTLQELLFPQEVVFCNVAWERIGFKKGRSRPAEDSNELLGRISYMTAIPAPCLVNVQLVFEQSVARRMSWAARRTTSKQEDIAYCLLGLFGISMPLLYGEGGNAFVRLQEEVLKASMDESIFTWVIKGDFHVRKDHPGLSMLAPHPIHFISCSDVHRMHVAQRAPYRISNRILEFESGAVRLDSDQQSIYLLELNCCVIPGSALLLSNHEQDWAENKANTCLVALSQYPHGIFRRIVHGSTGEELVSYLKKALPDTVATAVDRKLFYIVAARSVGKFGSGLSVDLVSSITRLSDHFGPERAEVSPG